MVPRPRPSAPIGRAGRRRARYHQSARHPRPVSRTRLTGLAGAAATLACLAPFLVGFVLPVAVIGHYAIAYPQGWFGPGLAKALSHTLTLGLSLIHI